MIKELLTVNFILLVSGIVLLINGIIAALYFYLRKNEKKEAFGYSLDRRHYEDQISEITNKLLMDEERWREVYHLLDNRTENDVFQERYDNVPYSQFLSRHGITRAQAVVANDEVFVLQPFSKTYRKVFYAIAETCNNKGLHCSMGNEDFISSDILPYVLKKIVRARLVIAVLDGRNSNVFYELGIAHALNKPTILVSNKLFNKETPVDVKSKYIIFYNDMYDLSKKLGNMLDKFKESINQENKFSTKSKYISGETKRFNIKDRLEIKLNEVVSENVRAHLLVTIRDSIFNNNFHFFCDVSSLKVNPGEKNSVIALYLRNEYTPEEVDELIDAINGLLPSNIFGVSYEIVEYASIDENRK